MRCLPLIEFDPEDPPQVWLTVFLDPPDAATGAPWSNRALSRALRLLRPGFRHVLAASPLAGGGWLVCNPGSCFLGIGHVPGDEPLRLIRHGVRCRLAHCVVVTARHPARIRLRGVFTCVNLVAHLLGVGCGPFTTPFGLYRRIAAMQE